MSLALTMEWEISYRYMVSTIPLTELLKCIQPRENFVSERYSSFQVNPVSIAHVLLQRPNVGNGMHWLYVPDPSIQFYRITFPHNINSVNCPDKQSALTLEFGGNVTDTTIAEQHSKHSLIAMGLMSKSELDAEIIWSKLNYGYVTYNDKWAVARNEILSYLRKHDVYCQGRYGRWEYSNMESALLQGREIQKRLGKITLVSVPSSKAIKKVKATTTQRYFTNKYPHRSNGISALFFRRGEKSRLEVVKRWFKHCEGDWIFLDAGCGDGEFILRFLNGVAAHLRIEDFVQARINEAQRKITT